MNIQASLKKFMGNKNTVTIIGVLICLVVLYVGYNMRISSVANLIEMPVASVDIQPRTLITQDLVQTVKVPGSLLKGSFYTTKKDIIGKYSNYNSMIAQGSLFYKALLINAEDMPSAVYRDVPEGHTVINYPVDMYTTYANSMEPDTYIDIYFKAILEDDDNDDSTPPPIMFGKFVENVKVLAVKDSAGQNVFETSEEVREPAYILFSVPTEIFELIRKAQYLSSEFGINITLAPNTIELTEENAVHATSEDIKDYIMDKSEMIDSNTELNPEDIHLPGADEETE